MTTADVLREARKLVERGWTQGAEARDAYGEPCEVTAKMAVCWCSIGAIVEATKGLHGKVYAEAGSFFREAIGSRYIPEWNDARGRTQAEVLAAFSRAIELAAAQEGVK